MNDIAKTIDATIAVALAPQLKALGFRKSGRTFYRVAGDCTQVINVQASLSNYAGQGKFTVNLGGFYPLLAELLTGLQPAPKPGALPKEYDCQLRRRIGELLPARRDFWWELAAGDRVDDLGRELAAAVADCGLPWLASVSTLPDLLVALEAQWHGPALVALYFHLGRRDEARACVLAILQEQPRAILLQAWAERLGILS